MSGSPGCARDLAVATHLHEGLIFQATSSARGVPPAPLARRAEVVWRALLATAGGYGLCALVAMTIGRLLPRLGVARIEAVATGELLAIVLMPIVPLFVFWARRPLTPTLALGAAIASLALGACLVGPAP